MNVADLPAWPERMNRKVAAAYVGGDGDLQVLRMFFGLEGEPERRKNLRFWRVDLDAAMARAKGRWPTAPEVARLEQMRRQKRLEESREEITPAA